MNGVYYYSTSCLLDPVTHSWNVSRYHANKRLKSEVALIYLCHCHEKDMSELARWPQDKEERHGTELLHLSLA